MKPLLLSVLFAAALSAGEYQAGPLHVITIQAQNYGLPGIEVPPFKVEWLQVLVSTTTPGIVGFRVTIRYREDGEIRAAHVPALFQGASRYAWGIFPGKPDVVKIEVEELRADPIIEIKP